MGAHGSSFSEKVCCAPTTTATCTSQGGENPPGHERRDLDNVPEIVTALQPSTTVLLPIAAGMTPWVSAQHFRLVRSVGKGSEGEVFEATWNGQTVAAKRLDIVAKPWEFGLVDQEQVVTLSEMHGSVIHQAVTEATALRALDDHENIAKLLGVIEGTLCGVRVPEYILMEYVQGGTLDGARPEDPEFLDIGRDVLSGLVHMHERSVVHRDIKPTNLMFDSNRRVKIVDFGFAKQLNGSTLVTNLKGTWCYTAPELKDQNETNGVRSTRPNYSVDMYSWGMTAFELLGLDPLLREKSSGFIAEATRIADRFPIMGKGLLSCISVKKSERRTASALLEETRGEREQLQPLE